MSQDNATPQESNETGTGGGTQPQSQEQQTQAQPKQTPESVAAFKALMDRERTLREREQKLQREAEELSRFRDIPKLAKDKPLEALRALGLDYEGLTKQIAKGERPDPVEPVRNEIQELKSQLQRLIEREQEQERLTATQQAQQGIREFVGASEDYPLTAHLDASDMVFDYVQNHHQATGEWLSETDAAREVEAYLSGLVEKAMELDAFRAKFTGRSQKSQETPHISNQDASQIEQRSGEMTSEEKIAMAAKMLRWREE